MAEKDAYANTPRLHRDNSRINVIETGFARLIWFESFVPVNLIP